MIYCLPIEAVVKINREFTDGAIRDRGALESALAQPLQGGFGVEEFYPTIAEKAAALLCGVAKAHGFVDGNKRTGWMCCVTFLRLHSITLREEADDYADDFVVRVVDSNLEVQEVAMWLLDQIGD
ncbi:type II toxin-antitoxin system death-on-curing family toxin [Amycolatopsis sp. NPDC054798]